MDLFSKTRGKLICAWSIPQLKCYAALMTIIFIINFYKNCRLFMLLCIPVSLGYFVFQFFIESRHIPWLTVKLSSNFYGLRSLSGRWVLCQYSRSDISCRDVIRLYIQENNLIETLSEGRYQAITHEVFVKRIKNNKRINITTCKAAHVATLQSILLSITKKRCKTCERKCKAWNTPARQFYLVKFTVENKE